MNRENFWETKKLNELTHDEWEALCDGCAKCCVQRQKDGTAIPPKNIGSLCYLLDLEPCRCSSYTNRHELAPECIILSPDLPELFERMPETCAYRLLHEGKPLPDWHPLVSGDPASALQHKIIFHGKLTLGNPAPAPVSVSPPTLQAIPETPAQMGEKTSQIAEDTKKMIYSTLDAAETTGLTGKFLATTSHEIRTALNGIVGMAQLISDTQLSYEQRNCINTILQSTTGLLKTINYVLDISKIESGQMEVCETILDLRSMCDRLSDTFRPLARQKGLAFKCECQRNVPISVMCDEGLLEHMLVNLLENALEHTHQGSVVLNIECRKKGPEGAGLSFQVIDTGTGIDEDRQAVIIGKPGQPHAGSFQQLHQESGMGLAICKQLVELMDGELGLVSAKGKGSKFSVDLTLRQANSPASFNLDRTKTITKPNTKVLLAEDNKANQKVVVSILRKAGCEIDVADNGEEAVQKFQENHYDMVLMDCQMPLMDGFEATARIRAMDEPTCRIPIIALTAQAMKGDKKRCLTCGMDDYLSKPIERQDLIDLINKYTSSR